MQSVQPDSQIQHRRRSRCRPTERAAGCRCRTAMRSRTRCSGRTRMPLRKNSPPRGNARRQWRPPGLPQRPSHRARWLLWNRSPCLGRPPRQRPDFRSRLPNSRRRPLPPRFRLPRFRLHAVRRRSCPRRRQNRSIDLSRQRRCRRPTSHHRVRPFQSPRRSRALWSNPRRTARRLLPILGGRSNSRARPTSIAHGRTFPGSKRRDLDKADADRPASLGAAGMRRCHLDNVAAPRAWRRPLFQGAAHPSPPPRHVTRERLTADLLDPSRAMPVALLYTSPLNGLRCTRYD